MIGSRIDLWQLAELSHIQRATRAMQLTNHSYMLLLLMLGLRLHIQLALLATETGRVEFHIPVLHFDTEIQTNKGTGSRANREATTDRHGDGLLI